MIVISEALTRMTYSKPTKIEPAAEADWRKYPNFKEDEFKEPEYTQDDFGDAWCKFWHLEKDFPDLNGLYEYAKEL